MENPEEKEEKKDEDEDELPPYFIRSETVSID